VPNERGRIAKRGGERNGASGDSVSNATPPVKHHEHPKPSHQTHHQTRLRHHPYIRLVRLRRQPPPRAVIRPQPFSWWRGWSGLSQPPTRQIAVLLKVGTLVRSCSWIRRVPEACCRRSRTEVPGTRALGLCRFVSRAANRELEHNLEQELEQRRGVGCPRVPPPIAKLD
jgi:hypothetical protein